MFATRDANAGKEARWTSVLFGRRERSSYATERGSCAWPCSAFVRKRTRFVLWDGEEEDGLEAVVMVMDVDGAFGGLEKAFGAKGRGRGWSCCIADLQ